MTILKLYTLALSLLAGDFYHLQITFANSLDSDQDQENVSPDLDPNGLNNLIVFLETFFRKS